MAAPGEPRRVAFVGSRLAIDACVLHAPAGGLAPTVLDFRVGGDPHELIAALEAAVPDVVIVFAPASVPRAQLSALAAVKLYVTADGQDAPADGYDGVIPAGRELPLPVDDRLFADARPWHDPPRALFLGASTEYRERFLIDSKHRHDLLHYAYGLWGDDLRAVLSRVDIGVNVHPEGEPAFEHRVLLHLAAGHLLLSEELKPTFGLRPEVDYVPVASGSELLALLGEVAEDPGRYESIRASGRAAAEAHRATRVWPALLGDGG